jgi:hypothetical protein
VFLLDAITTIGISYLILSYLLAPQLYFDDISEKEMTRSIKNGQLSEMDDAGRRI